MGENTKNKQKNELWHAIIVPVCLEVIFVGVQSMLGALGDNVKKVIPETLWIIIFGGIIPLVFITTVNLKKWDKIWIKAFKGVIYVIISGAILYFVICFVILFTLKTENQIPVIKGILTSILAVVMGIALIIYMKITTTGYELKSDFNGEHDYSVTGTCIAFKLSENKQYITTYMVKRIHCENQNEPKELWVFPGGHAFFDRSDDSHIKAYEFDPREIAVRKMKSEAGVSVKIFDLDDRHSPQIDTTGGIPDFDFKRTPHYTYLFHQSEHAGCYAARGHKYHYDCVFIGEQTDDYINVVNGYLLAKITLTVNDTTEDGIATAINDGIRSVDGISTVSIPTNSYQVYMLFRAHKDYIDKKRELHIL
jgi:hypothetical protein